MEALLFGDTTHDELVCPQDDSASQRGEDGLKEGRRLVQLSQGVMPPLVDEAIDADEHGEPSALATKTLTVGLEPLFWVGAG